VNYTFDRTTRLLLAAIVLLLAVIALRPYVEPSQIVRAQARFDHISILATNWLRNGRPGALLMDRRNGNLWYMPLQSDKGPGIGEPEFIARVPFEKLDQVPAGQ